MNIFVSTSIKSVTTIHVICKAFLNQRLKSSRKSLMTSPPLKTNNFTVLQCTMHVIFHSQQTQGIQDISFWIIMHKFKKWIGLCKICFTVGGFGDGFCTDPLSRRVYERRAGYENQPNRGSCPGETFSTTVLIQRCNE